MSWSITRTIRRLRSLIAMCTLALLVTPAARADFTPVASPVAGQGIHGFAASQGAWMVGLSGSVPAVQARITRDHGQSWAAVALPAGPGSSVGQFSGITVGPDGAFYVAARYPVAVAPGAFAQLLRVAPGDGVASFVDTLPLPAAGAALSAPAFDAQQRVWVAWVSPGSPTLTVARIASGAVAESYQAAAPSAASATRGEIQFRASGMWVRMGEKTYRLSDGALVLAPHGIPTLEDGPLVVASDAMSVDGGQSYAVGTRRTIAVEGDSSLLGSTTRILRRYSPSMFSATAQTWPQTGPLINRVIATDGGLVAFEDEWRQWQYVAQGWRMLWHPGAVTDPPFANGPIGATFTGWLTEANAYRAQAGLPPLLGDSAISAAAENHSRYWTLNPHVGDAHSETPGAPGFTGVSPSDRCVAAGGPFSCGEVMYSAPNPISWWISTPYHRHLIMYPTALTVGGGQVPGGLAVMNGSGGDGLLVGPVMFPRGAYTGPLEHSGEYPDAATECQKGGQQVTAPLGPSVSVSVPVGTLSGFTLSPAGGQPLRACILGAQLLTDDPLRPHTTYDATVLWQPSAGTAAQRLSWQFTTGAGAALLPSFLTFPGGLLPAPGPATIVPRGCTPSLKRIAARVTRPYKIAVRVRACGAGTVTVGVYRRVARTARQRRALAHKRFTMRAAGTRTVRLATRSLRPGRYALRITLTGAKNKKLNTTIVIAAAKRRR